MKSMRDHPKSEREFFEDKKGNIKYKSQCLSCSQPCKQSHKVLNIQCKKRDMVHTPKDYLTVIEKKKLNIADIAKQIGINSRTLKSMLIENQDMNFQVYDGLDKMLYPDSRRNKNKK